MARRTVRPVPDFPGRAVPYVRVSALMGRGGEDFHSPTVQTGAIGRAIALAGMRALDPVEDIDVSGTTFSRKGLDRIREMAEARQVDAIAIYDVSRLGRNVLESLRFIAWLAERGVAIISACEQVDTSTPAGKLMLTNMLAIAEYRAGEIGRNWQATIRNRAARGHHHGRPLGYRYDKEARGLVPDPTLGPAVTDVFRRYAAGEMISTIAARLAQARGKPVIIVNLKKILHNPAYLGVVTLAGEIVQESAAHTPLIDFDTWQRVQARLARDRREPSRHLHPTHPLAGLAYCPDGHRLQKNPTKYRGRQLDRLKCALGPSTGTAAGCRGIGFPVLAEVLDEVLRQVGIYAQRLRTEPAEQSAALARRARAGYSAATLERELTRTREAIKRLSKGWAMGDVPDSGYHEPMAELRAAEVDLERQLDEARTQAVVPPPVEVASAAELLLRLWDRMTVDEQRTALRAVLKRVVVRRADRWREPTGDRVTIEWL